MHRTDAEGNDGNLFTDGNPSLGIEATVVGAKFLNAVQEEIANVCEAAGIVLDDGDDTQLLQALIAAGFVVGPAGGDEPFSSPAIASNVLTLNLNASRVFKVAANANVTTTTIQNPPVNTKLGQFVVKYTADGSLRTWPWFTSTVVWDGGLAPTLPTTNGKRLWALFWTDDGGTTWFGQLIGARY